MRKFTVETLNPRKHPMTEEQKVNLEKLAVAMNILQEEYGIELFVTSGLRSDADQAVINPKAKKSNHLKGLACDVGDAAKKLKIWLNDHMDVLEKAGIYIEDRGSTPTWVHCQVVPPKSGKREFLP